MISCRNSMWVCNLYLCVVLVMDLCSRVVMDQIMALLSLLYTPSCDTQINCGFYTWLMSTKKTGLLHAIYYICCKKYNKQSKRVYVLLCWRKFGNMSYKRVKIQSHRLSCVKRGQQLSDSFIDYEPPLYFPPVRNHLIMRNGMHNYGLVK